MNKEQLLTRVNYFLNPENGIGAALYFVLENEGQTIIRFADIEDAAKQELKDRFLEYIRDTFIINDGFHYQNISEADDRKNVVYNYDLDEKPESLNVLDDILLNEEQPSFQFGQDDLRHLNGYLITIGNDGNKIALYKKHHPMNILKRDRFLLIPDGRRLVKIENDAIAIDKSFDFMKVDNSLIIIKLNILERFFGFEDVVKSQAQKTIGVIQANNFLEDIEQLNGITQNMTSARKLMRIRNSPVLNIPVANLINFIRIHPELTGKISFNENETRINLTTIASKNLFIKVLNDDYLFSQLTELQYDSHAKDKLIAVAVDG